MPQDIERKTQETPEAGVELGRARLEANRIDMDFSSRDATALREANEQPAIKDHVKNLQEKLGETQQTLTDLRNAVARGDHQSEDLKKKVEFQKLFNAADYKARHPFSKPETPGGVKSAQNGLEKAGENFQRRFVRDAAAMKSALESNSGQSGRDKEADLIANEYKVEHVRDNLSPEEFAKLQDKVSSALARLDALRPQIEEIAAGKALASSEKDQVLGDYDRMHEEYEKVRKELRQVVEDLEKAKR